MASRSLYPPIIETYPPAFIATTGCKLYFEYSSLNGYTSNDSLQITIINKKSNKSVVYDSNNTSSTILSLPVQVEEKTEDSDTNSYYVIISNDNIIGGFLYNTYYQAQVRLVRNGEYSEWSSGCLLKPISEPYLSITAFGDMTTEASSTVIKTLFDLPVISGTLEFKTTTTQKDADGVETTIETDVTDESELLKSYQIIISHEEENEEDEFEEVEDLNSGIEQITLTSSNHNQFSYASNLDYNTDVTYKITVNYTTNNLYEGSQSCYFKFYNSKQEITYVNAKKPIINTELGCIEIPMTISTIDRNIAIFRSSSKDDYKYWDELQIIPLYLDYLDTGLTFRDYTVESGYQYQYGLREIDYYGNYGSIYKPEEWKTDIIDMEHAYIYRNGVQLCIKYNPKISSFKYNISEALIETIGSKYPLFRRKGLTGYRSFPLTGTIEISMDEFWNGAINNSSSYPDNAISATKLRTFNTISYDKTDYNDQRKFREAVIDFLQANNVKLFKSATEGNILVKITDVSFTPNETLSRNIWDFSATLTEIADFTMNNCFTYGIEVKNSYVSKFEDYKKKNGQITGIFKLGENLVSSIEKKCELFGEVKTGSSTVTVPGTDGKTTMSEKAIEVNQYHYNQLDHVSSFNLTIDVSSMKPYLIDTSSISVINGIATSTQNQSNCVYGYLIEINNKKIIINPNGVYNFDTGMNIPINSIIVYGPDSSIYPNQTFSATIDYAYGYLINSISEKQPDTVEIKKLPGQLYGVFDSSDTNLYNHIYSLYYYDFDQYSDKLIALTMARIEAEPGTWIQLLDSEDNSDTNWEDHIIGPTGILELNSSSLSIKGIRAKGRVYLDDTLNDRYRRGYFVHKVNNTILDYLQYNENNKQLKTATGDIYSYTKDENDNMYVEMPISLNIEYYYTREKVTYKQTEQKIEEVSESDEN